jgi:hypothetical protein
MIEIEVSDFEPAGGWCSQSDTAGEAPREASDRMFLRLGEKAALGADSQQWILYRGREPKPDKPMPKGGLWQGKLWTGISFVRSTKAVLVRCIREKGVELSPEGRVALDALPDDFDSWKADPARRGTPVAPKARMPLEHAENELQLGSQRGRYKPTMIERLGPKCALGTDGLQWIVFRQINGQPFAWQDVSWRAVGYIHSDKRALVNCIAAKGLKLSASGRAALDRQDAKIYRWRMSRQTKLTPALGAAGSPRGGGAISATRDFAVPVASVGGPQGFAHRSSQNGQWRRCPRSNPTGALGCSRP